MRCLSRAAVSAVPNAVRRRPLRFRSAIALLVATCALALGACSIWPTSGDGPDVRVNGVSGTVLEAFGPTGGVINDFIAPSEYAHALGNGIHFDYPGQPTWVTVILHGANGIWDGGGPPRTVSLPGGTWDWLTAKVYWSKQEYAVYGWRLTDAAPGVLFTEPSRR